MGLGMMQSKAEIRSVATKSNESPRSKISRTLPLLRSEIGDLRQHLAFARDGIGHDAVKSRDPVRRDEEQRIAQVKDLPHFAALEIGNRRPASAPRLCAGWDWA